MDFNVEPAERVFEQYQSSIGFMYINQRENDKAKDLLSWLIYFEILLTLCVCYQCYMKWIQDESIL